MEIGGAQELLNMLGSAKDERTRKEAMKALAALSKSGKLYLDCFTHEYHPSQISKCNFV